MSVVGKFGGTSLKNQQAIRHVIDNIITKKNTIKSCIVCVSAPGKRNENDVKVTDSLIELHKLASERNRQSFDDMFENKIESRFLEISKQRNMQEALSVTALKIYDNAMYNNKSNSNSLDFTLSRGEYLNAIAIAELLSYDFIDAPEIIKFRDNCTVDYKKTFELINSNLF